ncbi:unnamed protein product [Prunus armeniaca]|uniref:ABC1 atypical kinase-like domain-containing protein n=1 Tax=Prunus armeniaca TaxID=36596 RepID=A0A6J5X480_PRUAR|nr:unnamed protein product [Prunus armeniaca]
MKKTIERAFGRKLPECFDDFEEKPVASGSIAQVRGAGQQQKSKTNDGDENLSAIPRNNDPFCSPFENGRFRAGSKSSPTCCGAFGRERGGSFGFLRAELGEAVAKLSSGGDASAQLHS